MRPSSAHRRVRLQRFLADAGVVSRRHAEELILEGHVIVNNAAVQRLPAFVDPAHDVVVVRGARVHVRPHEYFLVHKPKGVVCADRDPGGRTRVVDLLPPGVVRLLIVGKLDPDDDGLLLLTNDSELAARLVHPGFRVPKVYRAELRGLADAALLAGLRRGVWLVDGKLRADDAQLIHADRQRSLVEVTVSQGGSRQVGRMLARLGHPVRKLKRIRIGPLSLAGLPRGAARRLTADELAALRAAVAGKPRREKGGGGRAFVRGARRQAARGQVASASNLRPGGADAGPDRRARGKKGTTRPRPAPPTARPDGAPRATKRRFIT
ncbi:MAG: pseudouridine synthase [Phycisphaerae bacterium]|nr:rRNA pseudouridine synthase [Phycisphaerae bacterium]MCZ2399161.1 pseudouridine synthase [Phycisphaerae bacterium]